MLLAKCKHDDFVVMGQSFKYPIAIDGVCACCSIANDDECCSYLALLSWQQA